MDTYKLYALRTTPENIDAYGTERFIRATGEYLLLYTDKEKPENSIEVEGKHLSDADSKWLLDCNALLIIEHFQEQEEQIANAMGERVEALESLLREQKELIDNGTGN